MLSIRLVCVGKLREQFFVDAFNEYSKRLSAYCKFECAELNETKLGSSPSDKEIAAALDKEAADIERFRQGCLCYCNVRRGHTA